MRFLVFLMMTMIIIHATGVAAVPMVGMALMAGEALTVGEALTAGATPMAGDIPAIITLRPTIPRSHPPLCPVLNRGNERKGDRPV
ncbi:MAG: hypothetical protein OI74_10895 [Gammaproteobacteria bacterium (ex Lamellibrachia satsuma)]|nr:MAG: hypothetical protein OI74_10895 [Gammaproteobacteria bacterium (ex Lamellibrachia satsuma)]RRS36735.1 MAG: hypothetical protein NV67_05360 [Gammaproteobacteria bacterium (ex Lamellibrachia satsuma)]